MNVMMFAHNGSLNRGCEAIVRSTTEMLKKSTKDIHLTLASGRPNTDKDIIGLDEIFDGSVRNFENTLYNKARAFMELKMFKSQQFILTKMYQNIIKRIPEYDVCLSIGGDNYCYGEQDWLYAIDKNVKKQNKKLILWACSIGEEDLSSKKLADLKTFDLILARESLTYNLLKKRGMKNIKLCADPAFNLESKELPLLEGWKENDTIGLNFSPLVLKKNYKSKETIRELIIYILKNTESVIALTPHVMEEGNDDYKLLSDFYAEFKTSNRIILLPNNLNAMEYKGYIGRMKLFIGARTHATIAAYSSYVPTMVLGYSVKSRGIAKDIFGEEKLVLGIKDISQSEKLINGFKELLSEKECITRCLKENIPRIKNSSFQLYEYLKNISGGDRGEKEYIVYHT